MSITYEDPVVAEKQAAVLEEDGGSDLSLANGVARDYELKCALSESLVGALPHYARFIRLSSQQVPAGRVRTFLSHR